MSIVTMPTSTTSPTQRTRKSLTVQMRWTRPFSLLSSLMEPTLTLNGPKDTSVSSSPSGDIEEGSSVTLNCSSDANPAAQYTWFKVNTDHSLRNMSQGQQIIFNRILSSDSGQYICEAQNELGTKSVPVSIDVKYGPKDTSVSSSPSGDIEEGSSVTLSCSSDANPAAQYTWFKEHEDSVEERKMASRKASGPRPGTVEEPLPVYENIELANLTNRSAPAAQREPIEGQDDHLHDASIHHISRSENQEGR
ncbi:hypothetical protein CRUP_000608 [Coryphaenoides rupestris]|nr:hypothetical protein CRUP_000608 [Coryphaenoides rupestris]